MARSIFGGGGNPPPGCTNKDIEDAFKEGKPSALENFSWYISKHEGFLSREELEIYLYGKKPEVGSLLRKAIGWAWQEGYNQGKADEAQYQDHFEDEPRRWEDSD